MKTINLYEYQKIPPDRYDDIKSQLNDLNAFLIRSGYEKALTFGYDYVKADHFVGSIRYNDIQINIFPKYLAQEEYKSVKQLISMLAYTKKLEIVTPQANSQKYKGNYFLEVLISYYATNLFEGLIKHSPHRYQQKEENLNTIRGRIDFNSHIRYNFADKSRIFCRYEEFTTDNLLNRTLYFVSHLLYQQTENENSRDIFNKIFALYDDVCLMPVTFEQTKKIHLSKQQQKFFEIPFKLAQLFLEHSTISLYNTSFNNLAILFDMNKLFEEFVYEKLKKECSKNNRFHVQSQINRCLISGFESTINDVNMNLAIDTKKYTRTDIIIKEEDKIKYVIDTKYKDASKISSSDIYQMLAYARIHKTDNLILIYPKVMENYDCKAIFCNINESPNLRIITLDLTKHIENVRIIDAIKRDFIR